MFKSLATLVISLALAAIFFASPALAQATSEATVTSESPPSAEGSGEVNGEFRLHLSGEIERGYSFYMEASFGSGGEFLCTTDPAMIEVGYQECVADEMSLPFVAPAGEEISYRILGNPGAELSQFVVSEGTVTTSEGMVIDGYYEFPPSNAGAPDDTPVAEQYQDGVDRPVIEASPISLSDATTESTVETTTETSDLETTTPASGTESGVSRILPQSGGFSVPLIGGVALLIAGGFAFRRAML